jgi:hypothetical protein
MCIKYTKYLIKVGIFFVIFRFLFIVLNLKIPHIL